MQNPSVALAEFLKLYPFAFVLNEEGRVAELGPALRKLLEGRGPGADFNHLFEIQHPVGADVDALRSSGGGTLIKLRLTSRGTNFVAQAIPLSDGRSLFATNLVVQDADQLTRLGLAFTDFALNDSVFDYLMLLVTQKNSLQRLEEMNRKLSEAHQMAIQASETKSRFLANMSHELRTPMNGFLGMAGILMETELSAEQKDYLQTMIGSGEAMLALVNDILDLSKIEAGFVEFEEAPISVRALTDEIERTVRAIALKKGIELRWGVASDVPDTIIADQVRLRQVLLNLVGNALKFTLEGHVTLSVEAIHTSATLTELAFTIEDTGLGMSPETVARIFSPFVQGDSSMTKKFEGTGLGLAICKRLVEAMDGKINVTSAPGEGSRFRFTGIFHRPVVLAQPGATDL